MLVPDEIILPLVDEQIARKGRLLFADCHAGLEDGVGGFDVAVTMVEGDDYGLGVGKIHFCFLLS